MRKKINVFLLTLIIIRFNVLLLYLILRMFFIKNEYLDYIYKNT